MHRFAAEFLEDSTNVVRARLVSHDGSGAATGVTGEGNWIQVADVSSITCKIFRTNGPAPNTPDSEPAVTVGTSVLDVPLTTWDVDSTGFNFRHVLPVASFPIGKSEIEVEYKVTLASGVVFHFVAHGRVHTVRGS